MLEETCFLEEKEEGRKKFRFNLCLFFKKERNKQKKKLEQISLIDLNLIRMMSSLSMLFLILKFKKKQNLKKKKKP